MNHYHMRMTKKQARAILKLSDRIHKACEQARKDLKDWPDLDNANAYWLGHLESIASGYGYASMPVAEADKVLEDATEELSASFA